MGLFVSSVEKEAQRAEETYRGGYDWKHKVKRMPDINGAISILKDAGKTTYKSKDKVIIGMTYLSIAFKEREKGREDNYKNLLLEAEREFKSASPSELDGSAADMFYAPYGAVLLELGKLEEARKVLEEGSARYPTRRLARGIEAVNAAFNLRELDELLKKERPNDSDIDKLLEFAHMYEQGFGVTKIGLAFEGDNPFGSLIDAQKFRDNKTLEIYEKVLPFKPNDLQIRRKRTDLLGSTFVGRPDEAEREYRNLLESGLVQDEKDLHWINYALGLLYQEKLKDDKSAIMSYKTALHYAEKLEVHDKKEPKFDRRGRRIGLLVASVEDIQQRIKDISSVKREIIIDA